MKNDERCLPARELSEADKTHITILFFEEMVPRLRHAGARIGSLNCGFAGEDYRQWNLHFSSAGSGFRVTDFEFDGEAGDFSLDL